MTSNNGNSVDGQPIQSNYSDYCQSNPSGQVMPSQVKLKDNLIANKICFCDKIVTFYPQGLKQRFVSITALIIACRTASILIKKSQKSVSIHSGMNTTCGLPPFASHSSPPCLQSLADIELLQNINYSHVKDFAVTEFYNVWCTWNTQSQWSLKIGKIHDETSIFSLRQRSFKYGYLIIGCITERRRGTRGRKQFEILFFDRRLMKT